MIEGRHIRWLNTALRLTKQSDHWPYKMACVLVKGGSLVSRGVNKPGSGEAKDKRYTLGRGIHSELAAVLAASNPKGCTAYVAGLSKADNLICSKPCPLCESVLREAGVVDVYYYDQAGNICRMILGDTNTQRMTWLSTEVTSGR